MSDNPDGAVRPLIELDLGNRQSLREIVYQGLRQAILDGQIAPGERLVELKLAADLRISRTPIREALHKLELEGLVRATPPRGVVVTRVSRHEIEEIFEIRQLLEPYATGLCAEAFRPEDVRALANACDEALGYAFSEAPDPQVLAQKNLGFYNVFSDRCSNRQLGKLVRDLRDRFIFLDRTASASTLLNIEERRTTTRYMPLILEAIRARDRAEVERLVRERLDRLRTAAISHSA